MIQLNVTIIRKILSVKGGEGNCQKLYGCGEPELGNWFNGRTHCYKHVMTTHLATFQMSMWGCLAPAVCLRVSWVSRRPPWAW